MGDEIGLTARFSGKPLEQPKYSIRDVPKCSRDLSGSIIQEVTDREFFSKAMAEMVLLCNEVTRRRDSKTPARKSKKIKRTTKPLSLEYMADRLDVDDPLFGFIVRTKRLPPNSNLSQEQLLNFQEGMMQGFITVTTFTNWQKTFRWDSMHDSAFSYDEPELAEQMASQKRKVDYDGSLAAEMQNTVRCGDIWNEGIVFPHIAEISLLGGLGCGRTLVSLAIERLEGMSPKGNRNYDYVVLQATKNSVQFYETMGFVRVGAITRNENFKKNKLKIEEGENSSGTEIDQSTDHERGKFDESFFVLQATRTVRTTKMGQTPMDLAKQYHVNVWDIIFLNQFTYPEIEPRSWLKKGIELSCPDTTKFDGISNASYNEKSLAKSSATQWYLARNNETPKQIADKVKVPCEHLIAANRERFQDLAPNSRLMPRTRIQVSNLGIHHDEHIPYCHWTFPDDEFGNSEPSYMMARKLNRRKGRAVKVKPIEASLRAPKTIHVPSAIKSGEDIARTPLQESRKNVLLSQSQPVPRTNARRRHPDEPIPPQRPKSGYHFFLEHEKAKLKGNKIKMQTIVQKLELSEKWKELAPAEKMKFERKKERAKLKYEAALKKYENDLEKFRRLHPECADVDGEEEILKSTDYFDKVVTLNSDGQKETSGEFKYYYVLTFIPDLFWCHLAPLRRCGVFGPDRPEAGRPMWVLVDENEAKELDISASVCNIVESVATTKCQDADDEQWDILESMPGNTSDTCNIALEVGIDHENVTSIPRNKQNKRRRKMDDSSENKLSEESSCRKSARKTGKVRIGSSKTSNKGSDSVSKGKRKRSRGRVQKISSQESAELPSPTDSSVTDSTDNTQKYPERTKRNKHSSAKVTESALNSIKKSVASMPLSELGGREKKSELSCKRKESVSRCTSSDYIDKVVTLTSEGQEEVGGDFKYYYVLQFIPYLFRCKLVPMTICGGSGGSNPQSEGRPLWALVDEKKVTEIDVSADVCEIVESTATIKCTDANYERWDIYESGTFIREDTNDARSRFYTLAHNQGIKVDTNHDHAKYTKLPNKLKLKRRVGTDDGLVENQSYHTRGVAKVVKGIDQTCVGEYTNEPRITSSGPPALSKKSSDTPPTENDSNNCLIPKSAIPPKPDYCSQMNKLGSKRKNENNTIPVSPSISQSGIPESKLLNLTISLDRSSRSSDLIKKRCSKSVCIPLDPSTFSRDLEEDNGTNISASLIQPESDKLLSTIKKEYPSDTEQTASLKNITLLISEDSNQTFSDVSCEITTKEHTGKNSSKNIGITSPSKISQTSLPAKQKPITSFFRCIKQYRG